LVDLNKYNLITTISFIIDDIEAIQSFQNNGSNLMGVLYGLTLKIISQYSIDHLFPSTKKIIVEHIKDWTDRMTYQNSLGIFSCSLVPNKKLIFPSNIYYLSLLLDQLSPGQSFSIQSEIKDLLKMANIGTDHKGYIYVYTSENLFTQINKLVSNREGVRKTDMKHAKKIWLDSYRETWRTSLSTSCP
jgi:hypothetical protein